jgi:hypothetical protein
MLVLSWVLVPCGLVGGCQRFDITCYSNHLKPNGNYMSQLSYQSVALCFVFMGFVWFSLFLQSALKIELCNSEV